MADTSERERPEGDDEEEEEELDETVSIHESLVPEHD